MLLLLFSAGDGLSRHHLSGPHGRAALLPRLHVLPELLPLRRLEDAEAVRLRDSRAVHAGAGCDRAAGLYFAGGLPGSLRDCRAVCSGACRRVAAVGGLHSGAVHDDAPERRRRFPRHQYALLAGADLCPDPGLPALPLLQSLPVPLHGVRSVQRQLRRSLHDDERSGAHVAVAGRDDGAGRDRAGSDWADPRAGQPGRWRDDGAFVVSRCLFNRRERKGRGDEAGEELRGADCGPARSSLRLLTF